MLSQNLQRASRFVNGVSRLRYVTTFRPVGRKILPEDEAESAVPKWSWVPYRIMRAIHERHMSNPDYWSATRLSKIYNMHVERVEGIVMLIERENEFRRKGMNYPKYAHDYMDQWIMLDLHVAASHLAESERENLRALEFHELLECSVHPETIFPRTIPEHIDFSQFASTTIRRLERTQLREDYVPTVADYRRLIDEANANTIIPSLPAPVITKEKTKSRFAFREPSKKDMATLIIEKDGSIRHASLEEEMKRSWNRKPTFYNQMKSNFFTGKDPRDVTKFPADLNEFEGRMNFPWVYNHAAKKHKGENAKMLNRQLLPTHSLQEIMFGHTVDPIFRLQILWRDTHAVLTEVTKFIDNPTDENKKELIAYLTDVTRLGINSWDPASVEELSEKHIPAQLDALPRYREFDFNHEGELRMKLGKLVDKRRRASERHFDELNKLPSSVRMDDDDDVFDNEVDLYGSYRSIDGTINMKRFMYDVATFREMNKDVDAGNLNILTEMALLVDKDDDDDEGDVDKLSPIDKKLKFDALSIQYPLEAQVVNGKLGLTEYILNKLIDERQRYSKRLSDRVKYYHDLMDDRRIKSDKPFTYDRERIERKLKLRELDPHNRIADCWTRKTDVAYYSEPDLTKQYIDMSFASSSSSFTTLDRTIGLYELMTIKKCQEKLIKNGGKDLDGVLSAESLDRLNVVLNEMKLMTTDDVEDDGRKRNVPSRVLDEYDMPSDDEEEDDDSSDDDDSSSDDDDDDSSSDEDEKSNLLHSKSINKARLNTSKLSSKLNEFIPAGEEQQETFVVEHEDDKDEDGNPIETEIDDDDVIGTINSLLDEHEKVESSLSNRQLKFADIKDLLHDKSKYKKILLNIRSMNDKQHSRPISDVSLSQLADGGTGANDDDDDMDVDVVPPSSDLFDMIRTCHTVHPADIDVKWSRIKGFLDGSGVEVNDRQRQAIKEREAKIKKWSISEGGRLKKKGRTLVIAKSRWIMPPCCEDPHDLVPVQIQREIDGLVETHVPGFLSENMYGSAKTAADLDYFDTSILEDHSFVIDKEIGDELRDEDNDLKALARDRKYFERILEKKRRMMGESDIPRKGKVILDENYEPDEEDGDGESVTQKEA